MLKEEYPIRVLCDILDCAPSSYYYTSNRERDLQLREEIERIAMEFPRYGYRRMTAELRRRGYIVNHKKVLRIMREENLLVQVRRYLKTTLSNHDLGRYPNLIKDMEIVRPNQVWCGDITYIRLKKEYAYLAVLMDVFTRSIRGWEISRGLDEQLTISALQKALSSYSAPEIHHSDQGVQYACQRYVWMLQERGIKISMASKGKPQQNAYAERLIRTLKEEEVYLNEYEDIQDARRRIGYFLEVVYMQKRVHSALGYLTPKEFEQRWRERSKWS
jgi:transposase InsO family protein